MMKNTMPYLIVIAATFLLSGAVVVGTLFLRPDLLKGSTARTAPRDSTAAEKPPQYTRGIAGPTLDELKGPQGIGRDSLAIMRDSVRSLLASLDQERSRDRKTVQEPPPPASLQAVPAPAGAQPAAPDSAGLKLRKNRAKMLESMPAEDAAKILARLSDDETRALLQYVKARQAAKILAAFEPERASRLLR